MHSSQNEISNISVNKALEITDALAAQSAAPAGIQVHPRDAAGCVTSAPIKAKKDIPFRDNSAMDGFLVHESDLDAGQYLFTIEGEIRPEHHRPAPPKKGSCTRIMTGGGVPGDGFFVIPVEATRIAEDGKMEIINLPKNNAVRKQGEGYRSGSTVLEKGAVIRPYEAGLALESGNETIEIFRPLRIAIQVTGNEIDETTDTNGPVLEGLCNKWPGVKAERLPVLSDEPEKVKTAMARLAESYDIVFTTGGISAGEHDYIPGAMAELGAKLLIRKVLQKPGKPFTLNLLGSTPFFHLPGNPVSAVFCAEFYARSYVMKLQGVEPPALRARLTHPISNHRGGKTLFVSARLFTDRECVLRADSTGKMRSHLLQLYTGCQGYIRIEPETDLDTGDSVEVIPFSTGLF